MKTKTIKLTAHGNPKNPVFRVEQISDCADYLPGEYLEKELVDTLCRLKSWRVTIVPFVNNCA